MRAFKYTNLAEKKWDAEIVGLVSEIHRFAGRQELELKYKPNELEKLVEIAKVQSTEESNAIEGIRTTNTRVRQLIEDKTTPRNRSEQEIAGYRDVLSLIQENYKEIPITQNYILQLHSILYTYTNNPMAGITKDVQNYISSTFSDGHTETLFTPLSPIETGFALDKICEEYNKCLGNYRIEPLLLIPIFIQDFLCIHPFNDGNGRTSRLLTTLLLYQNGFWIGKYISLESKIAKTKESYYDALELAQRGWHEENNDATPFIKYMLGIILAAYRDFEDRYNLISEKSSSLDIVRKATQNILGRFVKSDIVAQCPSLSTSSIETALRKLCEQNEIKREGVGKSTYYYRIK